MYYKRGDFDFEIVNIAYLDVDVPRQASYGVSISHQIRFARMFFFFFFFFFFFYLD